jgi:hypothetical protein
LKELIWLKINWTPKAIMMMMMSIAQVRNPMKHHLIAQAKTLATQTIVHTPAMIQTPAFVDQSTSKRQSSRSRFGLEINATMIVIVTVVIMMIIPTPTAIAMIATSPNMIAHMINPPPTITTEDWLKSKRRLPRRPNPWHSHRLS